MAMHRKNKNYNKSQQTGKTKMLMDQMQPNFTRIFKQRQNVFYMMLMPLLLLTAAATIADAQHHDDPAISQISPKSSSQHPLIDNIDVSLYMRTSRIERLESTMPDYASNYPQSPKAQLPHEENETRQHVRVERSALPILNEHYPKSGPNDVLNGAANEQLKQNAAGRYFQYNIKPTGTYEGAGGLTLESAERTQRARAGKTLSITNAAATTTMNSFLLQGGPRQHMSGSPIKTSAMTTTTTTMITSTNTMPMHRLSTAIASPMSNATVSAPSHNARQNPSPDIQDIITGIVKLLNGNVNVHANTQGVRKPSASRINNRGPPRISESQTLPQDYDMQKPSTSLGSSIRPPPPYPFDRPERPFITGVPIPEQIVPYRPGFVSNRPPWHRNKPRPPITTTVNGARRPIPQYKPLPASQMNVADIETPVPQQEQQPPPLPLPMQEAPQEQESPPPSPTYTEYNDAVRPTDTTYDSEFSQEDTNTQYIEVSDQDADTAGGSTGMSGAAGAADYVDEDDLQPPSPVLPPVTTMPPPLLPPPKKEESSHKKKPGKHKTSDKKKSPSTSTDYTTIAETRSVVNTGPVMSSTYLPMPMDLDVDAHLSNIDPSSEEVIFMTPSRTPTLETSAQSKSKTSSKFSSHVASVTTTTSSISTAPIWENFNSLPEPDSSSTEIKATIIPTPSTTASTATTTMPIDTSTTTTTTTTTSTTTSTTPQPSYQPRPGIVLDDPEFKPGGRPRPPPAQQRPYEQPPARIPPTPPHHIQPTRQHLPPGYGEIFDVTLSAIQGPGTGGGSKQTINIKPYGSYGGATSGAGVVGGIAGQQPQQQGDIIVSAAGDDGFVSIDGKRTYINLFGDPTDPPAGVQEPTTPATAIPQLPGGGAVGVTPHNNRPTAGGTGYAVPETEIVELDTTKPNSPKPAQTPTTNTAPTRPHYRPRTTQPPVRIDTCIVGDDSTCDQAQHERCMTENGVSSCHCRPGYSRRKHREPCRKVISFYLGLRVDRIYEHRIVWDKKLMDHNSEPYGQLSYESIRAVDSAMSMTPYSDEFMEARVNNIYRGDPNLGGSGVFVNLTIRLDESVETLRPNLRSDVQKHLLGVIHRRNNNIGNSVLYVTSPEGAISALHDLDECESNELNDCHPSAVCTNSWGSFRCACDTGMRDPWSDQPQRAGRECQACPDSYCNNRGSCNYNEEGAQVCVCDASHYGGQCEIDGEVLGVAIGASVAAVIIIVLTLVCLIMWSRRWQREQKNAMGSPVFGYMNTAPLKSAAAASVMHGMAAQPGYQVTLEDRMRWAQIADVMAQTNHYGAEPIGPTRPSSAMFAYPNLQGMGHGMGTMGGMSMQSTMQMHQNANLPPVPLPRYERLAGLGARSSGMRTLENSSSSEEEDRTDLLGRNFQVPRPKSRSNGSIANQSGIYYDVDYEPSGNGIGNTSVDHLYGSQNQSQSHHSHAHSHSHSGGGGGNSHIPGPQGIPMSTYTSGRAPSSYYMK